MTKKTASKSAPKPAARASRAASAATAARASDERGARPEEPRASVGLTPVKSTASARASKAPARSTEGDTKKAVRSSDAEPAPKAAEATDEARTVETRSAAAEQVDKLIESADAASVLAHTEQLAGDKPNAVSASARVLEELVTRKPEMLVPVIDRLVQLVTGGQKRAVQTAATILPVMARVAPARVARHLPLLTERFADATDVGKDGLVATFAALCTASVAYQKRLEPVLELALSTAEPKTRHRWTEIVLPSLKGEPHARARAVVEDRLHVIPRPLAQPIATFLGIKLRPIAR